MRVGRNVGRLLCITTLVAAGAACGDDDDDGAVSTAGAAVATAASNAAADVSSAVDTATLPTTRSTATTAAGASTTGGATTTAAGGSTTAGAPATPQAIQEGCAVDTEIDAAFNAAPFPQGDQPTDAEIQALRQYLSTNVTPLLDRADALQIPELKADIATVVEPLRNFITNGDPAAFEDEDPAQMAADEHISKYFYDNCSGNKLEVTAQEYKFSAPTAGATVPAGTYRIHLTDAGKEAHEFVVLAKAPGVTETFDQILAEPEEQAMTKVVFAGSADPTAPGSDSYGNLTLDKPGDYIAVCFLPVGTTDLNTQADGPPHFTQGMQVQFTVA